jgi:hypothetical protein
MSFGELIRDFPREVLEVSASGKHGGRYIVRDWGALESYWRGKNGSGNAYHTAYGYRSTQAPKHHRVEYNTAIVKHFVMDFDCKDFKSGGTDVEFSFMQKQVRRLHQHLITNDYLHYIFFTGGGFHVYIPLAKTFLPTDGMEVTRIKSAGRKLMKKWHEQLDLSCNDPAVAFDLAGMIRIPNSYNAKRGCWVIPIGGEELMTLEYDDIYELAQDYRRGYVQQGTCEITLTLPTRNNAFTKKEQKKVSDLPTVSLGSLKVLPCIAQSALGPGNPTHRARYHLASYLADRLRWFFPIDSIPKDDLPAHVEQIVGICSEQGWVDWNEGVTKTQVESIVYKGYAHARCETLMEEGLCAGKCRYYDGTAEDLL